MQRYYDLDDLYFDVSTFNIVAAKNKVKSKKELLAQVDLIQEELNELRAGVLEDNPVEILDGAVDVAVTLIGLIEQLKNLGFNFDSAAHITAVNNLSKFTDSEQIAKNSVVSLKVGEPSRNFSIHFDKLSGLYAIKDDAGKVRKPIGYKKNNVSSCVPADYKEKISAN